MDINYKGSQGQTERAVVLQEEEDKLTVGENYLPEQIFSMDETSLLWKLDA